MNFVSLYMGHALLKGQFRLTNSQWKKKSYIVQTYIPALKPSVFEFKKALER